MASAHTDKVIDRSVKGMKDELQDNLWELNLKRYVDFGHSFSPVIEMRSLIDESVESLTHGQWSYRCFRCSFLFNNINE